MQRLDQAAVAALPRGDFNKPKPQSELTTVAVVARASLVWRLHSICSVSARCTMDCVACEKAWVRE